MRHNDKSIMFKRSAGDENSMQANKPSTTHYCSIEFSGLELSVSLGWPAQERLQEQIIKLDAKINFIKPLEACISDNLEDTYCYDILISVIKKNISSRQFRLVEHLGYEIYKIIKQTLPDNNNVNIRINKHPAIPNLTGGVTFYFGDENNAW